MSDIEVLQKMIDESNNIVFFGGAGVSTDSGIKDFRGENGLYKQKFKYSPEYMLSKNCFYDNTEDFYDFYKSQMNCLKFKPSTVHKYLKKLEDKGKLKGIITQNIDGLHQKAGSKCVYELHGTIYENYCLLCNKFYDAEYVFNSKGVPKCECGGVIKPNVVLYGENLSDSFNISYDLILEADMFIVAGSSLTVMPANSLVRAFKGKFLVIINNTKTDYDKYADLVIYDNIKKVFTMLKV